MKLTLTVKCGTCGSEDLQMPEEHELDQMVRCNSCKSDVADKAVIEKDLNAAAERESERLGSEIMKNLHKIQF